MKNIQFTKMDGAGNDFMVIDGITQEIDLKPSQIRTLSDRKKGIGFDQLLLLESSKKPGIDFNYKIHNADGSEAEQCGNGARCLYLFVKNKQLCSKTEIKVETKNSVMRIKDGPDENITVDMGLPEFSPSKIPFKALQKKSFYQLPVGKENIKIGAVSMGNPHAVQIVENLNLAPVLTQGPIIEKHDFFPKSCNAGFVEIMNKNHISIRVWERGAGETLSCGTGACAAAAVSIIWGLARSPVTVSTRGGRLTVDWCDQGQTLLLSGPARQVFCGEISI